MAERVLHGLGQLLVVAQAEPSKKCLSTTTDVMNFLAWLSPLSNGKSDTSTAMTTQSVFLSTLLLFFRLNLAQQLLSSSRAHSLPAIPVGEWSTRVAGPHGAAVLDGPPQHPAQRVPPSALPALPEPAVSRKSNLQRRLRYRIL